MRLPHRSGTLAALALAALAIADTAIAQSCARETQAATRCRFLVSEPRVFVLQAGARLKARPAQPVGFTILLDGWPCAASSTVLNDRVLATCKVVLAPAVHVVDAAVSGALLDGVGVIMEPRLRLAELPRESRDLYPRRPGLFSHIHLPRIP